MLGKHERADEWNHRGYPSLSLSVSLYVEVEKCGAVVMLMRLYRQTLYQAKIKVSPRFFPFGLRARG